MNYLQVVQVLVRTPKAQSDNQIESYEAFLQELRYAQMKEFRDQYQAYRNAQKLTALWSGDLDRWMALVTQFDGVPSPLELFGKIWNLPNSAIGMVIGGVSGMFGGSVGVGNNALEFTNNPLFNLFGGDRAMTFGNVIIYGRDAYGHASHERIHTYQGQFTGPAYFPLNAIGMALSILSYPIAPLRRVDPYHGRLNFMEGSPFSTDLYGPGP